MTFANHPGIKASPSNRPKHIAIIMDGNGRWATARKLNRTAGHRRGVLAVREIISACKEEEIKVLTLFAFGVENLKRPSKEVRNLFRIFFLALRKDITKLHENNVKLKIIGDRSIFNPGLLKAIRDAEQLTAQNSALVLNIAVNYSGRWDLLQGMQKVYHKIQKENGEGSALPISEEALGQELSLYGLPEPDLFIRTGGVQRISNFLLWDLAYTELFFTTTLWPDFTPHELKMALEDFALRERRFGLTGEQLE